MHAPEAWRTAAHASVILTSHSVHEPDDILEGSCITELGCHVLGGNHRRHCVANEVNPQIDVEMWRCGDVRAPWTAPGRAPWDVLNLHPCIFQLLRGKPYKSYSRCGDVEMWRCESALARKAGARGRMYKSYIRCGDVEMWRCGDVRAVRAPWPGRC